MHVICSVTMTVLISDVLLRITDILFSKLHLNKEIRKLLK